MRILHVATLITPDAAYGGPIRVATNQVAALRARGHEALLIAAGSGFGVMPQEYDGAPVRLFRARRIPGLGFAGTTAPSLYRWLSSNVGEWDLVHIHMARDLLTIPAAIITRLRGVPFVIQTHGMIDQSTRALAKAIDTVATSGLVRSAKVAFHLTDRERADLLDLGGQAVKLHPLRNGVPEDEERPVERDLGGAMEILYLARLHPRKRPESVARAAVSLRVRYPSAHFALVGPDEGGLTDVRHVLASARAGARLTIEGPIHPSLVRERMRRCAIFVLPSVDEPYPMSVLEAMSVGKPVVVTDTCGISTLIHEAHAGVVTDGTQPSLERALAELLERADLREQMGRNARRAAIQLFGMSPVADVLEQKYEEVIGQCKSTL